MVKHLAKALAERVNGPTLVFWIAGEFTGNPVIPRTACKVWFCPFQRPSHNT